MVFSSLDTDSPRLSARHSCLSCRLDGLTVADREANRYLKLQELGLLTANSVTLFEEAIQTVARTLDVPICWLTLMTGDSLQLKAATGLSCLGLMNPLATHRQLSRQEAYCTQVVDSAATLIFPDVLTEPLFATGKLYEQYGLRSYLGAPLLSAEGICLGTLAVLDLSPRSFSNQDVAFLTMSARWCLSEFERNHYLEQSNTPLVFSPGKGEDVSSSSTTTIPPVLNQIQLKLLHHLIRQLQPDLTAIIGMSSVLKGGMFGQLNAKQGEYLTIIHRSGEKINMAIAEMLQLDAEAPQLEALDLLPVNLELLVQQVVNQLEDYGNQRQLKTRLSNEPGKKIWMLDKAKVKSALYYLLAGLRDSAEPEAEIRVHVARRKSSLTAAVWMYHPWIGEGLPQVPLQPPLIQSNQTDDATWRQPRMNKFEQRITLDQIEAVLDQIGPDYQNPSHHLHHWLGLMLSITLCEYHDGQILVQGSADAGYRYVLQWPKIAPTAPSSSASP